MKLLGRISWFASLAMAVHEAVNQEPAWATMFLAFTCLLAIELNANRPPEDTER